MDHISTRKGEDDGTRHAKVVGHIGKGEDEPCPVGRPHWQKGKNVVRVVGYIGKGKEPCQSGRLHW